MKKYKSYIIGVLLLLTGLIIGWIIKPNQPLSNSDHMHPSSDNSQISASANPLIYTCSMHPQIRQNEPGICPICEMDLIPIDNTLADDNPMILKMTKEAAKLAQVETFIAGQSSGIASTENKQKVSVDVDGTVEIDERLVKSQTAHLGGRIDEMTVTYAGQYVSKSQKIARIYSIDLLAASQELITAAQYNDRVDGIKDASIQKLKNWKISDGQIQQILASGKPIESIDIFADHSGYVLDKKFSQGDYIRQGQALYTIGSTSNLWLLFNVYESDLVNVGKGSKVTFTTPSLPGEEFKATINYISPLLNGQSRTATARAEIQNKSNKLKPGMLLDGKIEATHASQKNKKSQVLIIPNSAILWTGEKSVVYVQLQDTEVPSYEFREVKVVNRSADFSVIESGIEPGDQVVTKGAFVIDAAAQLNNSRSMMNRNVSIKKDALSDKIPSFVEDTPNQFKHQLDELVVQYIALKDALVNTDASKASSEAKIFLEKIEIVDASILKGEAYLYWIEQVKSLKEHATKIYDAGDVAKERNQFDFLSQTMIRSLTAFGTENKTYYVQYCPMVKDNQGADWIATEEEIRNPYFGDKMMRCGSVKLVIE